MLRGAVQPLPGRVFAIGLPAMHLPAPIPLQKRADPFDDPDWLFELKYDGFRALAVLDNARCQLISRNGNPFASFAELAQQISCIPDRKLTVLDGEIVCLDRKGRPQFRDLLFRRGDPCFFAFDLLAANGQDWRTERLIDRKQELCGYWGECLRIRR
jgi:bifunctional non-homologous end joining protein LigD